MLRYEDIYQWERLNPCELFKRIILNEIGDAQFCLELGCPLLV